MFFQHIVNIFIKNNSNVKDEKVRNSYGVFGGIVGIFINLLLFVIKFYLFHSSSILNEYF